ncbi:MAG: HNH endonuclease, partial [Deltaproteobacteria bacterium]|nr:HNH endonuclease [Deltaproteobacteria bacterium]
NEEEINLEHILPQNLTDDWEHFDAETARSYVKRIGNLALMKKTGNDEVGNENFATKAKIYSKSELRLTKKIPIYGINGKWTKESIENRQRTLAEIAVKAWPNKVG